MADSEQRVSFAEQKVSFAEQIVSSAERKFCLRLLSKLLNVFDVAPSSVADVDAFQNAAKADTRVSKFLTPPNDPGLHFEIPQPQT